MGEYADDLIDAGMMEDFPFGRNMPRKWHKPKKTAKAGDECHAKDCPGHYVTRTNSKTRHDFLGCNRFPECRSTV